MYKRQYLYRLPAEAVLYATALCIFPTAAVLMAGYRRFRRKYRTAERIRKEFLTDPDSFYLDELPQAKSAMELEYHRLIFMLFEDRKRMSSRFEESKGDMTDYYTMWVHQIKTPISAMRLLLQTGGADLGGENGELAEQLFKIEEYVNMVLQYLRLDGGNDLVIKTYELDGIVRQAVRKYAGMFVRKRLTLNYLPPQTVVLTDEKWLVFVIEQIPVSYTHLTLPTILLV